MGKSAVRKVRKKGKVLKFYLGKDRGVNFNSLGGAYYVFIF